MPRIPDHLIAISDITGSSVTDGEIRCNLGDASTNEGYAGDAPIWNPPGFYSRPANPTPDGACMALSVVDGNTKHIVGTIDNRFTERPSALLHGESLMCSTAGNFVRCHADGSNSIFTTSGGGTDGGQIYVSVSPTEGFEVETPWGRMSLGPRGFHVVHSSGARIDMGAIGGLPGPFSALSSYAKIQAATVSVLGSAVSLGTTSGAINEIAVTTLYAYLAVLAAAINALAPGAVPVPPPPPILDIGKVV